ncbi:MAG: hypothetical protein J6C30_08805 [Lentisphaeria bacterium]|nr:hypothetical protein [Lentisphaeria bacterium]
MAEDLQGLLNRIQNDGLRKAENEREQIIAEAKAEAEKIVAEAKAQAAALEKQAAESAAAMQERAKITIQQAARDIVIGLKVELQERLRRIAKGSVEAAMTPQLMAQLIGAMANAYAQDSAKGIELILSQKDLDNLEQGLFASLSADLMAKCELSLGNDFSAGLKIGFKDNDIFLDFSDEALADVICEFVGPKLAALIKG